MLAVFRNRLSRLKLSARQKGWIFSFLFGIAIVSVFYTLRWLIPPTHERHNEILTIVFIILSVLILFPAREILLRRILMRAEYASLFGQDFHHLDFIARHFTVDALVDEIFPELMAWLEVRNGRLAVLGSDRQHFLFHSYRNGQVTRARFTGTPPDEDLIQLLKQTNDPLDHREEQGEAAWEMLNKYRASIIQPFFYRRRLLGYLILNEVPHSRFARRALNMFARKAAVSIQNHILSAKIIDSQAYEYELRNARKVRNLLESAPIPRIPGYSFNLLRESQMPCVLEFFAGKDVWYLAILCSPRHNSAAGLIMSGILGHLYSTMHREKNISLHRLLNELRKDPELAFSAYPFEILLAELRPESNSLVLMVDGKDYHITHPDEPNRSLISVGWRNFLELGEDETIRIAFQDAPLLDIARTNGQDTGPNPEPMYMPQAEQRPFTRFTAPLLP